MLLSQGTYFVLAVSYLCCPCIQLLKYNAKFSYKKKKKKKVDVCVMVMCELLELGGIINNDMIINYTIIVNEVDAAIQNNAYMYKIAKYQ